MDLCGSLLEEATEDNIDDHMSSFSDLVDDVLDMAEPGLSPKPPMRSILPSKVS